MDIRIYLKEPIDNAPGVKTVTLVPDNFFQQVFEKTEKQENRVLERPVSEVVYSRSDYNDYR